MNVFIDKDLEEQYGEDLYKEHLEKEIERLNNIINELENMMKQEIEDLEEHIKEDELIGLHTFNAIRRMYITEKQNYLRKIKELKGSDKE